MTMQLEDGARVAVLGGGPGGSFFAYFLLEFAERLDLRVNVDIYEPRDFTIPGPAACNMCGGIVSERLVQALAVEGVDLPPTVVQRGIDSYVLHTEESTVRIDTPLQEKRIAALHRGGGPRDVEEVKWGGLDGYLQGLARNKGAEVVPVRVGDVGWDDGRPQVVLKDGAQTYDLLVGATGVNSGAWDLYEKLGLQSRPVTTKAYITELKVGREAIAEHFGNSMHIYFLNMARLDCAAIIPKGEYVTVCLLGDDIDRELVDSFLACDPVRGTFKSLPAPSEGACHCSPKINLREATSPFADRVVLVGDCGVTRLYKDGIGAAYRTAKAAARTAAFSGISAEHFKKHYWSTYRGIADDNRYGRLSFAAVHRIKALRPLVRGVVKMTAREQARPGATRRMSIVLWDMFTGSAPYRDVFFRALNPWFIGRLAWDSALSVFGNGRRPAEEEQAYGRRAAG